MSTAGEIAARTVMNLHGEPCRLVLQSDPDNPITTTCIITNEQGEAIKGRVVTAQVFVTVMNEHELQAGDVADVIDRTTGAVAMRVRITKPREKRRYYRVYSGIEESIS